MIKIALTNLGKYNQGVLDYVWLTLPATDEEIESAFDEIQVSHDNTHFYSDGCGGIATSDFYGEYEEYFITDYESDFYEVSEYENLESLNELAENISNLEEWEVDIVKALINLGKSYDEAIDNVNNVIVYSGCEDMEDVAYKYVEECGLFYGIPDSITNYFDYEALGRDLSMDGEWFEIDGSMAVLYR